MSHGPWEWFGFGGLILALFLIDFFVIHRRPHQVGFQESLLSSLFFIAVGLGFSLWIALKQGGGAAQAYLSGYLVEKSLSLDNIFVIAILIKQFTIPPRYQHRVLFLGIIGAIFFRGIFIYLGVELIESFHWMLYLFSGFIVVMGIRLLFHQHQKEHSPPKRLHHMIKKILPMTSEHHEGKLIVRLKSRGWVITPIFQALISIELMDVLFALDSIPAILVITKDPYIVFTSNVFAIIGMRSLYFVLSASLEKFTYLHQALAVILVFIGSKIFITKIFSLSEFPNSLSLGVILMVLVVGVLCSIYHRRMPHKK